MWGSEQALSHCATQPSKRTASHSLQAMQRSSPVGYLLRACSPLKRVLMAPFSKG